MYIRASAIFFTVSLFLLNSCSPKQSDIVLSEFGRQEITMEEFEAAYAKNSGGVQMAKDDSLAELRNFLKLYTEFKMKLRDAEVRGFDQKEDLQKELASYKKKIGVTLLLDNQIVEPSLHDLYEKREYEVRVSHIMFRENDTNGKEKSKLANAVLDSIKNGADFGAMAKKYSEDLYSKGKGGDIGFITGGLLPENFEDAVYETAVGNVYPEVVKTDYGYHIIKVTDKQKRIPKIEASHILIRFRGNDTLQAYNKIDSILTQLKNGADFAKLAVKYSEDPGSSERGGNLGFFERNMVVPAFGEAAFNLKEGEISGIVRTRFGYHIIKVTAHQTQPPFEEAKENLKTILKQKRYEEKYDSLVATLKAKYNFKVIGKTLDYLINNSDSAKVGSYNGLLDNAGKMELYAYAGNSVDAGSFLNQLSSNQKYSGKLIDSQLITDALREITAEDILQKEAVNLMESDPEFRKLMEDYENGIYIFELQKEEIWDKINLDSARLYQYYTETKENYTLPDRADFGEIYSSKDSIINLVYDKLQAGINFDSLAVKYTERPGYQSKAGHFGLLPAASSDLAKKAFQLSEGEFSEPFENDKGYSIVILFEKDTARLKTFEEAKAEISTAYQQQQSKALEDAHIQRLTERYEPVFYYDKLSQAFKTE